MNISPGMTVVRASDLMVAEVAEEMVMFDVNAGKYYALNEIAAEVWRRLERPLSVASLCEGLLQRFEVSAEQCAREVSGFLEELRSRGLIRTTSPISEKDERP